MSPSLVDAAGSGDTLARHPGRIVGREENHAWCNLLRSRQFLAQRHALVQRPTEFGVTESLRLIGLGIAGRYDIDTDADWSLGRTDLWAIVPAGRQISKKSRVFIDFLERQLKRPRSPLAD